MMCINTKAMPISDINYNCNITATELILTYHIRFVSHLIVPLVINRLGGEHTHTHTHTQTQTQTNTLKHTHKHTHILKPEASHPKMMPSRGNGHKSRFYRPGWLVVHLCLDISCCLQNDRWQVVHTNDLHHHMQVKSLCTNSSPSGTILCFQIP